ncbi:MAG: ferrous iron transport protein A [Suipraeoptans sp.]
MDKLKELKEGQCATIAGVKGDTRFLSRITSIGLTLGCQVEVLRNERKLPILIYSRDSMIALNRNECDMIFVEVSK